MKRLVVIAVLGACGGHSTEEIESVPIAPVTGEAGYVVNGTDNSISVIDVAHDEVVGTIELRGVDYPHHIYASSDGLKLLVAVPGADFSGGHSGGGHGGHAGGGAVIALDATTGALIASRRLDAANHNATYSPDGRTIWTSQMATPGQVLILDAATLATRSTITVGDNPAEVTFAPSGTVGFVANTGSDSISILDATTGSMLDTQPVGDAPIGAWPGRDGRMYVDNEAGKSISVIDPDTRVVVATFPLGFTPALAAISPSGELWVTDTDNGKLVFLNPANGMRIGELATAAGAHALAFSKDGKKAYVTNQDAASVTVVDVASRAATKTIPVGTKPNGIAIR